MKKFLRLKKKDIFLVNILIAALILLAVISGCSEPREHFEVELPEAGLPEEELNAHAKIFERRIEKVTDGVHVAVGYALANVIILGTDEGNIIVDTTESAEAAEEIINDFAEISESAGQGYYLYSRSP